MNVVRSKVMGFCSGVSRAIKLAEAALEQNAKNSKKIYSLGPLIHNQIALAELERRGLKILDENEIPSLDENCVVLIRAHGVCPQILDKIKAFGATVIDATCPRVALNQKRAAEFSKKGFAVILAGDANHGEVKAIQGCAGEKFTLVQDVSTALDMTNDAADMTNDAAVTPSAVEGACGAVLLSQTTFSPEEFQKIAAALLKKMPDLQVFNTICPATQKRQEALFELAKNAGAIIVVGGKKSANTRRLYELASSLCPKTFFVENAAELQDETTKAALFGVETVGITAGASTPDFLIDEVEKFLLGGD